MVWLVNGYGERPLPARFDKKPHFERTAKTAALQSCAVDMSAFQTATKADID